MTKNNTMTELFPRIQLAEGEKNLYNWTLDIDFLRAVKKTVRDKGYAENFSLEYVEEVLLAAEKLINKGE